jgi:sugar phosphate isomerase/epimerase
MKQAMQLLCSTGAFSRYPDSTDYRAILEYGPQLAVDGLEVMFYPAWYPDLERIADDLQRSGLRFPAIHAEKSIGVALGKPEQAERGQAVRDLSENCRFAGLIGAKTLVVHLWGWPELDDDLERNLQHLESCLDSAAQYGVELAIETIPCRQFDPLSNVQRAIARDGRCLIALDSEFLAQHQQLADVFTADWVWQDERVRHVHIKDYDSQPFLPDGRRRYLHPGEGHIDFRHFFAQLQRRGFAGNISLEAPTIDRAGNVDIRKLHASLEGVRQLMEQPEA